MFYNRAKLKKEALAELKGNWKNAGLIGFYLFIPMIAGTAVFIKLILPKIEDLENAVLSELLIFLFGNLLPFFAVLYSVLSVLYLAMFRWSSILSRKRKSGMENFYHSMTPKAIPAFFWMALRSFLWFLLSYVAMVPSFLAAVTIAERLMTDSVLIVFLPIFSIVLFGIAYFVFFAKVTSYQMCFLALADKKDLKILESLRVAVKVTDGFRTNLFVMNFSFAGWYLLCIITFGIASIWVVPYYSQVMTKAWQFMLSEKTEVLSPDENKTEPQAEQGEK